MEHEGIIKHWAKTGQIMERGRVATEWRLMRRDRGDSPVFDFDLYDYKAPEEYTGPRGHICWKNDKMRFEKDPKGQFVLAADFDALLAEYEKAKEKLKTYEW